MNIADTSTPVVVLNCKLGALGIMRSLGKKGITVHGVDSDYRSAGFRSRYCGRKIYLDLTESNIAEYLNALLKLGGSFSKKAVLFWTSDETAVFCARFAQQLRQYYVFPQNTPELIDQIQDKKGMYGLALKHSIPTPRTEFPNNLEEVERYLPEAIFPIMLKGIIGNKLLARTGKKMVLVHNREELIENYKLLEDPSDPNLMLQEGIPGDDDQVWIFNGYFDKNSDCLNPFTGHKVRQFPVHVGCGSLGICKWNEEVAELTMRFMKELGYCGILDIGYRLDPRDGKYKVLDINPRIGQAFRIFVAQNNSDVCRDMYLDLSGQTREKTIPCEGRQWVIEDFDFISSVDYYYEGTLTIGQWWRSFEGLKEGAWWYLRDPMPFVYMAAALIKRGFRRVLIRFGILEDKEK